MINAETLNQLTAGWMFLAVVTFLFLLKQKQPYGRHASEKWGPMMSNKWGWVIQEAPSMIFLSLFFFLGEIHKTPVSYLLWGLWMIHYINRTFIFPFRIRTEGKKMPMVIVGSAILFNFMNGFLNGHWLGNFGGNYDPATYFTSVQFIVGILIFLSGLIINNYSDNLLIHLRKPGETGYKIPTGGLFRYVSCPNHLGEIIEWIGYAVLSGGLPAWSFALWAFCNLVPRTLDHHKWYLSNFPDYPKERKAVIPFVI